MLTMLLGIGGGFILVPAMIYLLGMPARVVDRHVAGDHPRHRRGNDHGPRADDPRGRHRPRRAAAGRRRRRRAIWRAPRDADEAGPAALGACRSSSCSSPGGWRSASPGVPTRSSRWNICEARPPPPSWRCMSLALMAQAKPVLVPDVSARRIEIRYSFTGAQLLLFGAILYPRGRSARDGRPTSPSSFAAPSSRSSFARSRRSPASG